MKMWTIIVNEKDQFEVIGFECTPEEAENGKQLRDQFIPDYRMHTGELGAYRYLHEHLLAK